MRSSIWIYGIAVFVLSGAIASGQINNNCAQEKIRCVAPDATAEYATIQAAVDDAADGDEVVLCGAGNYNGFRNGNINFAEFRANGHSQITVRSLNPSDPVVVAATVANGQAPAGHFSLRFGANS